MYDINFKNLKKGRKFGLVFLFVGIIFLVIFGALLFGPIIKKLSLDGEVEAYNIEINSHVDSEGSTMYSPIYYYSVDGVNYTCSSSMSSSFKPKENERTVWYDVNNPSNCVSEYDGEINLFVMLFLIIPVIAIYIGFKKVREVNKRINVVKHLNQIGKLVKGIPYTLESTGMSVNDRSVLKPVVNYQLPNGNFVRLEGDPRHDFKERDEDGLVDMLIDEENPELYYIDLEINRYSGNRSEDYYKENGVVIEASVPQSELNQQVDYYGDNKPL